MSETITFGQMLKLALKTQIASELSDAMVLHDLSISDLADRSELHSDVICGVLHSQSVLSVDQLSDLFVAAGKRVRIIVHALPAAAQPEVVAATLAKTIKD